MHACICFMQWLEDDLLGYLDDWKKSVDKCTLPDVPLAEKHTMLLSKEREGMYITGEYSRL